MGVGSRFAVSSSVHSCSLRGAPPRPPPPLLHPLQEAGTEWGCTLAVPRGSIPNEHGTWHLGRDGWCDGQNVRPWVVDVTDALFPPAGAAVAANNTLWYAGYFQGHTPAPQVRMAGSMPAPACMCSRWPRMHAPCS
jgi:hypothetical protein